MIRRLLAVLALLVTVAAVAAEPATAAPPVSVPAHSIVDLATGHIVTMPMPPNMFSTPAGDICFYDYWSTGNVGYECFAGSFVPAWPACSILGSAMRRKTSYIWNNSGYGFYVETGSAPGVNDCYGYQGVIYPHSDGNMASPFNNSIVGVARS